MRRPAITFVLIATLLGAVATLAPRPWYQTDRDTYDAISRDIVIVDCSDLHCFRVLVAWTLGRLPGPPLLKWKAYAVLANTGAAMAVGRLCLLLGLQARVAYMATWIAAFGFGSLFTLFDPYTSDPLMFLMGPLVLGEMVRGRHGRGGLIGSLGVFAKEFAAAPLWIYTMWMMLRRRWDLAVRGLAAAVGVTLVWMALQAWLILRYNYSYAGSASADLLGGGYLARWLSFVSPRVAAAVIVAQFGTLLVLAPVGLLRCGRDLRLLAASCLPIAIALAYVQQPDRALWNLHFVVIPLAVLVLAELADVWCGLFIACYAVANLRVGAQLAFVPPTKFGLALSMVIALFAIGRAMTRRQAPVVAGREDVIRRRPARSLLVAEAVVMLVLGALMFDVWQHKRVEQDRGVNVRGFRGLARITKRPQSHRVAVVGGSAAYGPRVVWAETLPYDLERRLNESSREKFPGTFTEVVNLAAVSDGASSYVDTLRDYAYLDADVVCVYDGYAGPDHGSARRGSVVFRYAGYLPLLPALLRRDPFWTAPETAAVWPALSEQAGPASIMSCDDGSRGYCAAMLNTVKWSLGQNKPIVIVTPPYISARHRAQQEALAARLRERFGARPDVMYVNLGQAVDMADSALASDGRYLTAAGNARIAERLADPILEMLGRLQASRPGKS